MSITRHHQGQVALGASTLTALLSVANQHGFNAAWVHNQLATHGGNAYNVLHRLGQEAVDDFTEYLAENQVSSFKGNNEPKAGDKRTLGGDTVPNTPASAPMDPEAQNDSQGGGRGGMEANITLEGPVWTHFPNTQAAYLRWRETFYYEDNAFVNQDRQVYGNPTLFSATTLALGGGGIVTERTNETLDAINTNGYDFSLPLLFQLRMTTPYSIMQSVGTLATPLVPSQPNWLPFFDQKYQFYHQLECDWKATLDFGTPSKQVGGPANQDNFQNYGIWIFYRYTNADNPPTQWIFNTAGWANQTQMTASTLGNPGGTNMVEDNAAGTYTTDGAVPKTYNLTSDDYERMGGWKKKYVSWSTTHHTSCVLTGKYIFGQCKMDVKTIAANANVGGAIGTTEEWSPTGATAVFPENLSIIAVQDCGRHAAKNATTVPFSISFETGHKLVFKDLRANYKFPTPALNQGITASAAFRGDEMNFYRSMGS